MKVAVCRAHGQPLTIENATLAIPGPDEIRVKLSACAICHSDIAYMDGAWGGTLPAVFGHEAAGIIEAVGPNVEEFSSGDAVVISLIRACGQCHFCDQSTPVLCETRFRLDENSPLTTASGDPLHVEMRTGAFAESIVIHRSQVVALPETIPMTSAALLGCGVLTGVGAVTRSAQLRPGDTMGVIGTGGVGLNCLQGGVLAKAGKIIALDICDDKLADAKKFGATHLCNPIQTDADAFCKAQTDNRGLDAVFVSVGSPRALEQAVKLVKRGGTVVMIGMPANGDIAHIHAANLAANSLKVIGSKMGDSIIQEDIPWLIAQYENGKLKLDELVSHQLPFTEINQAIIASRQPDARRVVLTFSENAAEPNT